MWEESGSGGCAGRIVWGLLVEKGDRWLEGAADAGGGGGLIGDSKIENGQLKMGREERGVWEFESFGAKAWV
jgi:hypothetical protein